MLRNYLIIAFRHLTRHKLFSAINIVCLSIGITFTMLIGDYILKQRSVNADIRHVENQYVIKSKWKVKDMGLPVTTVAALPNGLKKNYPTLVKDVYRFNPVTNVVSAGDKHFKENIAICDTNLVSMYGLPLLQGDPAHAFRNSNSAVITEEFAIKLFGTTNALDKTVTITSISSVKQDFVVSAVLKSMSYNTVNNYLGKDGHSLFVPFEGNQFFPDNTYQDKWDNIYMPAMIELQPGKTSKDLARPIAEILALNLPANLKGLLEPELVSMKDYYLKDNNGAVEKMISTLTLIAVFIVLMAMINFVNISIGTSSYRLKEIGLRKVFGSAKRQLVFQHLSESIVLILIATLLSMVLYEVTRPIFSDILQTKLDPIWQFSWMMTGLLLGLALIIGLISGIYPAFILSSANIIHAVKGKIDTAKGGMLLRRSLLVVQFTLATFIFISALNISKQVTYFFNKDLGYDKERVLVITAFPKQWDSLGIKRMETIRDGLLQVPAVKSASICFEVPDRMPPGTVDLVSGETSNGKITVARVIGVDENYANTLGMKMKEGTFFKDYANTSRTNELVLNEEAEKALGLKSAMGKTISSPSGNNTFTISGVTKDFNYSTMQDNIGPIAFMHVKDTRSYRYLAVKLQSDDMSNAIAAVKTKWNDLTPGSPFDYNLMDDRFAAIYQSELQLKKASGVATFLNLLIVFMGIFGIVAFTLAKRLKEIAVRKVLGADLKNILFLFIKDYAMLITIATMIAWPLAYIATDKWLQNYAYRVHQDMVPYLFVSLILFVTSFLFISAQCFRAASNSPVNSLRSE